MTAECHARSRSGYRRGKARVDRLIADLACGECDAQRFVHAVTAACGDIDSETLGLIGGLAERLAAALLTRDSGALPGELSA